MLDIGLVGIPVVGDHDVREIGCGLTYLCGEGHLDHVRTVGIGAGLGDCFTDVIPKVGFGNSPYQVVRFSIVRVYFFGYCSNTTGCFFPVIVGMEECLGHLGNSIEVFIHSLCTNSQYEVFATSFNATVYYEGNRINWFRLCFNNVDLDKSFDHHTVTVHQLYVYNWCTIDSCRVGFINVIYAGRDFRTFQLDKLLLVCSVGTQFVFDGIAVCIIQVEYIAESIGVEIKHCSDIYSPSVNYVKEIERFIVNQFHNGTVFFCKSLGIIQ